MVKFSSIAFAVLLAGASGMAFAQDKPVLTIYTYDGFASEWGPGVPLKQGFEADCDCIVNFVGADSSIGTLRRVQLEGESTEADIVLGLDTAIAGEARATGLFADHGLQLTDLALPEAWNDAQFVPFDYSHFAFMHDTDTMPVPPGNFQELIALPDDIKIVIQDPRSATPGLGLLLWVKAAYGDQAPEIWAGLKPKILTITREWSESYALFLDGEADMVLSYTTSPAYHIYDEDDHTIKAALFEEGHFPQIEVAGILKSSDQQELAQQFLAYLASPAGQQYIPTTNWMFPVVDLGDALDPSFAGLPQPEKTLTLPEADIIAHSAEWVDEMLAAVQ
ncbi:thiamine ABC transporter substrate binding subunit [Devosia sp. YIM 151766]|uniref:thiamine ABC transporter substrate binding subunit n=1 Tax=Devosia sp. YIM 151766 TaxID=3017325 RepID=UPI00255C990E|nr:thiamine ABC transporter substrate binding subunit [Devosia sp. YIM 151766]WIY52294.1 thiamine ABC transporter substrate binding subunit [Devosia sp. YIM 151766]